MKVKDLTFKPHYNSLHTDVTTAKVTFENGYGISILAGGDGSAYRCSSTTYEVAILHNKRITYSTHLTDDVLNHQTEEQVNTIIEQVKQLKGK